LLLGILSDYFISAQIEFWQFAELHTPNKGFEHKCIPNDPDLSW
jgi:hypothetical protein